MKLLKMIPLLALCLVPNHLSRAQPQTLSFLSPMVGPDLTAPRGWPLEIRRFSFVAPIHEPILIKSESGTELRVPATRPNRWWLSAEQTRSFPLGAATVQVGDAAAQVIFGEVSQPLPAGLSDKKRLKDLRYALETGQALAAQQQAEAWLTESPEIAMPRVLLGQALEQQGLLPEALAQYETVLGTVSWIEPPRSLLKKASRVRTQLFAEFPQRFAEPLPVLDGDPTTLEEQDRVFGADAAGQWASSATASSEYDSSGWSASNATSTPDVTQYGDARNAWASKLPDAGLEWIELSYPKPVYATVVRVRQNYNPGAISKVELLDAMGVVATVLNSKDSTTYPPDQIAWLVITFSPTTRPIQRVRITLDSAAVPGWNEIDAVQLVGNDGITNSPPVRVIRTVFNPSDQTFAITWSSRAGQRYEVQRSVTPNGPWTNLTGGVTATGDLSTISDLVADRGTAFYRVIPAP